MSPGAEPSSRHRGHAHARHPKQHRSHDDVMPAPQPDHLDTHTWLEHLYGHADGGWLTLFSFNRSNASRGVDWAPAHDLDSLTAAAARREPQGCVWFGVATRNERLANGQRGGDADCTAIPGLWLDIDVEGPGHKADHRLARDRTHAHRIANAFPLPPTAVIDSGGGLQAWWLFSEMVDLDQHARTLLSAWGATWARLGDERDVDLDNVFDPARIMRLPGTTNRKEGLARPVELVHADWTLRYGLDDIESHLDAAPTPPAHRSKDAVPYIGPERPGDAYNARHTGGDVLKAVGFTLARTDRGGDEHWCRPGKEKRDGTSATVYAEDGHTTIWSDTCANQWPGLEVRRPYDAFGLYAAIEHRGDWAEATRTLRSKGYGSTDDVQVVDRDDLVEPWADPQPFPGAPTPPPFPIESLPTWAQDHAIAAADQVQVPADLTAMLTIGALSAAATGRARVHVSPNWSEPVNLYLVTAMRSGAGKSPAEKFTAEWLRRWERNRVDLVMPEWKKKNQLLRLAEKKHATLERSQGAVADSEVFDAMDAVTAAEEAMPVLPYLIADDATPEAVALLLKAHGERQAVISTEADLFDMVLKGKPGQRASINVYLKAWSGDSLIRNRKGSNEAGPERTELRNPLLTVSVLVQPSVLAALHADGEMVSRGFAARFMFSVPPDMIGGRDQERRFDETPLATLPAYEAAATALADRWATWANPADLRFSTEARNLFKAFLIEIEPRLGADQDLEHLAEWANKLHGSIARYAGLLHLAEGNDSGANIEVDTVARAIELGRYWLANAVAVLELAKERVFEQAEAIVEWIADSGDAQATLSHVQQNLRRPGLGLDKVADFIPAVEALIDHGWLRPLTSGDWRANIGVRGTKSPNFALWPSAVGNPRRVRVQRVQSSVLRERASLSSSPPTPVPPPPLDLSSELSELPRDDERSELSELGSGVDAPGPTAEHIDGLSADSIFADIDPAIGAPT